MVMEEQIKEFAESFVTKCSERVGVNLQYDRDSVAWVSDYIERVRLHLDEASLDGLVNWIGSFLGECLIGNYGGEWRESEGMWGVFFSEANDKNAAFPFNKVRKQLVNGAGDSILSFYDVIPIILGKSNEI